MASNASSMFLLLAMLPINAWADATASKGGARAISGSDIIFLPSKFLYTWVVYAFKICPYQCHMAYYYYLFLLCKWRVEWIMSRMRDEGPTLGKNESPNAGQEWIMKIRVMLTTYVSFYRSPEWLLEKFLILLTINGASLSRNVCCCS